jgi:hypothetical protein
MTRLRRAMTRSTHAYCCSSDDETEALGRLVARAGLSGGVLLEAAASTGGGDMW